MLKNLSGLLERPAALRDRIFGRIFDVAEFASLDDDDKKKYINAMNTERDTYNQIEYAREQGMEKGIQQGVARGKTEDAMKMLELGIPVETIAAVTGFSEEEILKMRNAQAV